MSSGMSNEEIIRLVLERDGFEGLDDLADKAKAAKKGFEDVGHASEETAQKSRAAGQAFLEVGRAFQDFSQGGIGGVLNNLEGLGRAFTNLKEISLGALLGPSGIAGMLTLVGTAAYVGFPYVRDFVKTLVDGANDIPKATTALGALEEQLKKDRDRLEELQKQHKLTNTELAEYNRLTAEAARLTEEAAKAKERDATMTKLRRGQGNLSPEVAEEAQAVLSQPGMTSRVEGMVAGRMREQSVNSGRIGELRKRLDSRVRERERTRARYAAADQDVPPEYEQAIFLEISKLEQQLREEEAGIGQRASAAVADAAGGDVGALDTVLANLPMGPEWRQLYGATPGMLRAADDDVAAAEAFGQRAHDAGIRRRERAEQARRQGQAIDAQGEHWGREDRHDQAERERLAKEEANVVRAANARERAEAEQQAAKARVEAEKAAREADPLNVLRRAQEEERRRAAAEVARQNQAGGHNMTAAQLQQATADAVDQLPATGGDIAAAVWNAVQMGYQRAWQQQARQMQRMQMQGESFFPE